MGNHTILLVDYEPRSVERSRKPLADAGFKVEIASDGVAALEAFERLKPDLVLIEAMLPKKHGFEVCQELKKTPEGKRTPILITTGVYKGRKYRSQALHLHGCDEYIEKPIGDDALLAVVRRFLDAPAAGASAPSVGSVAGASTVGPSPAKSAAPPAPATIEPAAERPSPPVQPPPAPPTNKPAAAEKKPAPDATPSNGPALKSRPAPPSWGGGASGEEGEVTEDEIMARLDAILPPVGPTRASASQVGSDPVPSSLSAGPAVAIAEAPDDTAADLEAVADFLSEADSACLLERVVPAPLADDRSPEACLAEAPLLEPAIAPDYSDRQEPAPHAHVVPFDEGRSKKQVKKGRNRRKDEPSATPTPPEPSASPVAVSVASDVGATAASAPNATLAAVGPLLESPSTRTLPDEPTPEVKAAHRGVPFWAWLLGAAAVAITVYFAFFRGEPPEAIQPVTSPAPSGRLVPAEPDPTPPADIEPAALPESATSALPVLDVASVPPEPTSAVALPLQEAPPSGPSLPEAFGRSSAGKARRSGARLPTGPTVRTASQATPAPAAITPDPTVSVPTPSAAAPSAPPRADGAADLNGLGIEPVPTQILTASPTTKRAVLSGDLVSLGEADYPPIALHRPAPSYPTRARLAGQSGTVMLSVLVDGTGHVADVQVLRAIPGSDLHVSAAATARTWTYKPATKDGLPVKVWKSEQVVFAP